MTTNAVESSPFHARYLSPDGDIVLKSSDGILFRVDSHILKAAFGFFREMLEMPRDSREHVEEPLPMGEAGATIESALDLVNPGSQLPTLTSIPQAERLLLFARKYDSPRAVAVLSSLIMSTPTLFGQALEVYALASRYDLRDLAKAASTGCLSIDIGNLDLGTILRSVEGSYFYELFALHQRRKQMITEALRSVVKGTTTLGLSWAAIQNDRPPRTSFCSPSLCMPALKKDWSTLIRVVATEMDKCSLGTTMRDVGFWECLEIQGVWEQICNNDSSNPKTRRCLNKVATINAVLRAFDHLPLAV